MLPPSLTSSASFKHHFTEHLVKLLNEDELGVFILVVANASMDAEVFDELKPRLQRRLETFRQRLRQGDFPVDDVNAFHQLDQLGLEAAGQVSRRHCGPWQLQFIPLRGMRPARSSQGGPNKLFQPFNPAGFNFNKPFLRREIIWQGDFAGRNLRLFYNKFPFADYHALAVIDGDEQRPQFIESADCDYLQRLIDGLRDLPEIGFAYNSLAAFASVNHQHWQLFLSEQRYPIESPQWKHNGGALPNPLAIGVYQSLSEAWPAIEQRQRNNRPFNLFVRPDRCYLIARQAQGSVTDNQLCHGFAWSELAGCLTLETLQLCDEVSTRKIERALQSWRDEL